MTSQSKRELFWFFSVTLILQFLLVYCFVTFGPTQGELDENGQGPYLVYFLILLLAGFSPTFTSLLLTAVFGGYRGLRLLFANFFTLKVGIFWWLYAIIVMPGVYILYELFSLLVLGHSDAVDMRKWIVDLPILIATGFFIYDVGASGEELGWRGYALPRMLEGMMPLTAALVLGVIWAFWHLPAWWITFMHFKDFNFFLYIAQVTGLSLVMTVIYVNTKGSVFLSGIVVHLLANASGRIFSDGAGIGNHGLWIVTTGCLLFTVPFLKDLLTRPPLSRENMPQYYDER